MGDANTNTGTNEAAAAFAAGSKAYREAMAAAILGTKNAILIAQTGHGTAAAAMDAAVMSGAKDVLFIMPKNMAETVLQQLTSIGIKPAYSAIRDGRGGAARMCSTAMRGRNEPLVNGMPRVWAATVNQVAEIAGWHEAWKTDLKSGGPFGFLFAFDAPSFASNKSRRGRGLRLIAGYAKHTVLFYGESQADPNTIKALTANFGAPVRPASPALCRQASSACKAMCPDD